MTVVFADLKVKITKQSFRLKCGVGPLAGTVRSERGRGLRWELLCGQVAVSV